MIEEVKTNIENAAKVYSEKSMLRSLITAIPYIGSPIDTFISSEASKVIYKRFEYLIESLKQEIQKIEEKKFDKNFLESEEFCHIALLTFEKTAKTRQQKKIFLYAKVLIGCTVLKTIDIAEEYLNTLSELSENEIIVAEAIYKMQKDIDFNSKENSILNKITNADWEKLPQKVPQEIKNLLSSYLSRLERTGLIKEITGSYCNYTGGVYHITEYFKEMMKFIANSKFNFNIGGLNEF